VLRAPHRDAREASELRPPRRLRDPTLRSALTSEVADLLPADTPTDRSRHDFATEPSADTDPRLASDPLTTEREARLEASSADTETPSDTPE